MGNIKVRGVKIIRQIIGNSCSKSLNALLQTLAPQLRKLGAEKILLRFWTLQKCKDQRNMTVKGLEELVMPEQAKNHINPLNGWKNDRTGGMNSLEERFVQISRIISLKIGYRFCPGGILLLLFSSTELECIICYRTCGIDTLTLA